MENYLSIDIKIKFPLFLKQINKRVYICTRTCICLKFDPTIYIPANRSKSRYKFRRCFDYNCNIVKILI